MKIHRLFPALLLFASFLAACGDEGGTENQNQPQETEEKDAGDSENATGGIPFDPNAIYLERMYATSTGSQSVAQLLDGDAGTYWEAMPSAGPDEGIMMYFESPVFIEKVRMLGPSAGSSDIQALGLYANGSEIGEAALGAEIKVAADVQSLYVRIAKVAGAEVENQESEEASSSITRFPSQMKTRLGEIELYGNGGKKLTVRPLHLEKGDVASSSVLSPAAAYDEDYLFDSRLEFGWAEGKEDEGVGESITFNFDKEMKIEKLKIWNGYQRSDDHFQKNAKVKDFSFGIKGGDAANYQLGNSQNATTIDLDKPLSGKSFTFTVKSAYPGTRYKDLLLSEIRFFDGQQWFGIESAGEAKRKKELAEQVAGTPLESLLDRNITYVDEDFINEGEISQRIILRSNGSFVIYKDSKGYIDNSIKELSEVADGNWEIQSLSPSQAKIKVFGKLHRIMERDLVYQGSVNSVGKRIFSEILTITPQGIQGGPFFTSMPLHLPN